MPRTVEPQPLPSPGQDRRRILSSPTPQKAARSREIPGMARQTLYPIEPNNLADIDGESMSASRWSEGRQSLGHRSFSVRSRSPPPGMEVVVDELEGLRR